MSIHFLCGLSFVEEDYEDCGAFSGSGFLMSDQLFMLLSWLSDRMVRKGIQSKFRSYRATQLSAPAYSTAAALSI